MGEFIYCQRDIPKEKWRYGLRSSGATGCGWIGVYNVLTLMGEKADPEQIIRQLEHQVPLLHGNAGTLALGPYWYFRKQGFGAAHTACPERFDELVKESDGAVVFYYWRNKWRLGAHFAAVSYRDGRFWGYNTYKNSTGPDCLGESLEKFLKDRRYFGAVLTTVTKP